MNRNEIIINNNMIQNKVLIMNFKREKKET